MAVGIRVRVVIMILKGFRTAMIRVDNVYRIQVRRIDNGFLYSFLRNNLVESSEHLATFTDVESLIREQYGDKSEELLQQIRDQLEDYMF